MFGFFKDLMLVGSVSSNLGKTVSNFCQYDYLSELSNKDRNYLADDVIKEAEKLHGKKISNNFMPADDLMIIGFMLLAKKIGEKNFIHHRVILMGLMSYISVALEQNAEISQELILEVTDYTGRFSFK